MGGTSQKQSKFAPQQEDNNADANRRTSMFQYLTNQQSISEGAPSPISQINNKSRSNIVVSSQNQNNKTHQSNMSQDVYQ